MFDGIARLGDEPVPARPNALDTRALAPLLRVHPVEKQVRALSHAVAINAQVTAQWIRANWGDDADVRDVAHPVYAAGLDPTSPVARLIGAQEALLSACQHYRSKTGQDGLALARGVVEGYGPDIAERALLPIENADALSARIAAELRSPDPQLSSSDWELVIDELLTPAEPPVLAPTPEQWDAGRSAIVEWMLTDEGLDGVNERLGALLSACKAEGATDTTPAVNRAAESLSAAIRDAIQQGYDAECMREVLACWSAATGGPRITLTIEEPLKDRVISDPCHIFAPFRPLAWPSADKSSTPPRIEEN